VATKLRDLVKDLNRGDGIKGFIVYKEETEEERERKKQEQEKIKELIRQNQGDT
jgi:hypothetical protein